MKPLTLLALVLAIAGCQTDSSVTGNKYDVDLANEKAGELEGAQLTLVGRAVYDGELYIGPRSRLNKPGERLIQIDVGEALRFLTEDKLLDVQGSCLRVTGIFHVRNVHHPSLLSSLDKLTELRVVHQC